MEVLLTMRRSSDAVQEIRRTGQSRRSLAGGWDSLGQGWERTHDGLDRVYLFGCIAGFVLVAWLTCGVVVGTLTFVPMISRFPWSPFVVLICLSIATVHHAWENDEDLRLYIAFICLGWSLVIPAVGVFILAAILGLGLFALAGSATLASAYLVKCLAVPAETQGRPFVASAIASGVLAVSFFAGGILQGLRHVSGLMQPNEIPYLQEFFFSGILLLILGNSMLAVFLRLIPNVFGDRATGEYVTSYVIYVFAFAASALVITYLIVSGILVSDEPYGEQVGPAICWIVLTTLGSINIAWLLRCVAASRDLIRPYFR